eukprot:TRINITY_DN6568_c0_g1_i1.p1 TRINITY_DN6568_c0_g1~~TRINITY_DN6568_c0_g1_i1.p1  ORF type:complete len:63 (+),score=7.15 TRINITY_DN6568_c0_g1_i1:233-421(+)
MLKINPLFQGLVVSYLCEDLTELTPKFIAKKLLEEGINADYFEFPGETRTIGAGELVYTKDI